MATRVDTIGRGWAFPFRFSVIGRTGKIVGITPADSAEKIRMAIRQILGTKIGSRMIDRDFGTDLRNILFYPIDEFSAARVRLAVSEAISRWERRAEVQEVKVSIERAKEGMIEVSISLKIVSTQDVFNLVYPFYLTPEMMVQNQVNVR
jgi:hypothetical protein